MPAGLSQDTLSFQAVGIQDDSLLLEPLYRKSIHNCTASKKAKEQPQSYAHCIKPCSMSLYHL